MLATDKVDKKKDKESDRVRGVIFKSMIKSFMTLWGFETEHELPESEQDGMPILTEEHFRKNIHLLTGEDFPYFGKLLYLYLARGRDQIKITVMRFFEGLAPFAYEENKAM